MSDALYHVMLVLLFDFLLQDDLKLDCEQKAHGYSGIQSASMLEHSIANPHVITMYGQHRTHHIRMRQYYIM